MKDFLKYFLPATAGIYAFSHFNGGNVANALSLEKVDPAWVYGVVQDFNKSGYFSNNIDPVLIMSMIKQESSFNPNAKRFESHIVNKFSMYTSGDASIGLMQTLTSTANWLYSDMGYNKYIPSLEALKNPITSIYFGCAYLNWMLKRDEDLTNVQLAEYYNGGYGNSNTQTRSHAEKVIDNYNKYKMEGY